MFRITMTLAVLLTVSTAAFGQEAGEVGSNTTLIVTNIVGLLTLLATQLFAMWRASQQRKWDVEDREMQRREATKRFEEQRQETFAAAVTLAKVTKTNSDQLAQALSRNTELTQEVGSKADAAYAAANNFTERLEALRQEITANGIKEGTNDEESTHRG